MDRKTIVNVLHAIDDKLYVLYPKRYASMLLYGGAAAWLAGVTKRPPTNINVAISAAPSYIEPILKALGLEQNAKFYPHQSKGLIQIDGIDVLMYISSPWYYHQDVAKRHAMHVCSLFDVPQHRVVMHYQNGLSEPVYYGWADTWTKETMCNSYLDVCTNTMRIYKFLQAGYSMSSEIALLGTLGSLGISKNIWANQHGITVSDDWIGWNELPTFVCQVAMSTGTSQ